jgi:hypothetical protein
MVSDSHVDGLNEFNVGSLNKAVNKFHKVEDITLETGFRIKAFEGMETIGTRGNDRLHASAGPGFYITLSAPREIPTIPHMKSPAAAAGFLISHDAEINTSLFKETHGYPGYLPQFVVIAGSAANMKKNLGLLFSEVLYIEPVRPSATLCLGFHHHVRFFSEAFNNGHVRRKDLAILNQPES